VATDDQPSRSLSREPPGPRTSKTQHPTQNRAGSTAQLRRGFAPPPQQGAPLHPSDAKHRQGTPHGPLNAERCSGDKPPETPRRPAFRLAALTYTRG
jgi:hypothetical protein